MSLLDDRHDAVTLIPEIEGQDDNGNAKRVPDPDPDHHVTIFGRFQMSSSTETVNGGQVVSTTSVFITRSFPGGAWAKIMYGGRQWDVQGEIMRSSGSAMTRHDTVTLKARAPEAVIVSG